MLNFKKLTKGLKSTWVLQWIICTVLWSLSIVPVQAEDALWQNPYTGRVISLPDYISVKLEDDLIYINKIAKNNTVTSISLQGKAIELYPGAMQYPNSTSLLGYPILKKQTILPEQNGFEINVEGAVWDVIFFNSNEEDKFSSSLQLLKMILPSMKPLGKNEHFNLVLPWSDETVDLGPRRIEEGKLIYEPLEGRAGGFALNERRGKGIKIYDGYVYIKLGNVTISMNGAPFSWQNQDSKMQDLLAGFSSEDSNFKVKTISLSNRIVYEIRLNNSDIDFSQFFILVKNRLWTIVVSDIGSNHPNREPLVKKDTYMAIVERLIATIPDNPPNIETTFINQQTKKQLKLPDGWGVLQEFKHGEPLSQIGVYQYGKIDEANYILYDCSPLFLGGLTWDPDFNYSERITFGGRDAVKQAHREFIVSARGENDACQLMINSQNPSKEILRVAEELFATGKR